MKRTKYDELGKTLRKLEKQQQEKKRGTNDCQTR